MTARRSKVQVQDGGPEVAGIPLFALAEEPEVVARRFGSIAALFFIAGALFGIPGSLLIDPRPSPALYLVTLAGVASGLACLAIPWERAQRWWIHAVSVLAVIEIAVAVAIGGDPFVFYFLLIVVFAASVFRARREIAAHLGLVAAVLLLPVLVAPDATRATLVQALIAIPSFVLAAGTIAYLRERLESNQRATRRFAAEALALSSRIARSGEVPARASRALPTVRGRTSRRGLRAAALAGSLALAAPIFTAGLAAAGVRLPESVRGPFNEVGIVLPNQEGVRTASTVEVEPASASDFRSERTTSAAKGSKAGKADRKQRRGERGERDTTPAGAPAPQSSAATGAGAPAAQPSAASPQPAPDLDGVTPSNPTGPLEPVEPRVRDGIREITNLLQVLPPLEPPERTDGSER